jgi:hypothetical protein
MPTTEVAEISGLTLPSKSYHNFVNLSRLAYVGEEGALFGLDDKRAFISR